MRRQASGVRCEPGAWSMGHGAWSMEHGAWGMEHGAWGFIALIFVEILFKCVFRLPMIGFPDKLCMVVP
jgi:aromatic ring-opening dioxygenase catalytic subunit (LigB family)